MNYISDILYWISTGLLVPVIVLLIILFGRSVLLLGNFFGQYLAIRKTDALLRKELEVSTVQAKIQSDAKEEMSRSQREYFLREQIQALKRELGDEDLSAAESDVSGG